MGQTIIGIDFSGAQDAGRHIWITEGTINGSVLDVTTCKQATDYFDCSAAQGTVYQYLVELIVQQQDATVGIDCPFSIPKAAFDTIFTVSRWEAFITSPRWGNLNPNTFQGQCKNVCGNALRDTEAVHRADCPYSQRVYKQLFYGIRDVLEPLVQRGVSVAPMVDAGSNVTVLETYPAATLARGDQFFATRYKGRSGTTARRRHNVQELSHLTAIDLGTISQQKVIDDTDGDALDSLIAALATFKASGSPFSVTPMTPVEGYIYA